MNSIGQPPDPELVLKMESDTKQNCVSLIIRTGLILKIDHTAIITGVSLLHRFYAEQSVFKNDRFLVSMACIFLGGKVADSPKSSRDVLMAGFGVLYPRDKPTKEWLDSARKKLFKAERAVIYQTGLKFPWKTANEYMVDLLREKKLNSFLTDTLQDDAKKFNNLANALVNSSAKIPLVLDYHPKTIAAACVWFAMKMLKLPDTSLNQSRPWYTDYATAQELKDIAERLSRTLVEKAIAIESWDNTPKTNA